MTTNERSVLHETVAVHHDSPYIKINAVPPFPDGETASAQVSDSLQESSHDEKMTADYEEADDWCERSLFVRVNDHFFCPLFDAPWL
jgi:hypothetical protein